MLGMLTLWPRSENGLIILGSYFDFLVIPVFWHLQLLKTIWNNVCFCHRGPQNDIPGPFRTSTYFHDSGLCFKGEKAKKYTDKITELMFLKENNSFLENNVKRDINQIKMFNSNK